MPSDRFPSVAAPPGRPRRLHPASTFRDVPLRQVAGGLAPLVVLAGSFGWAATVALLGVALGALALLRILAWQRHTYRLTDDAIVERKGVVNRRERVVEFARIQQVEVNRTVVDRFLGTAELRIETAGDASESELSLRVVAEDEAERLRRELRARGEPQTATDDEQIHAPPETRLVEVPLRHVVIAAVTGSRLLIVPAVLIGLFGILDDLQVLQPDPGDVESFATTVGIIGALVLAFVLAVVGIAGAAVTGVLRDGGFRLVARNGDLHVRRGLLSTREAVIPRSRVQRVTVQRNWIRRTLGYGTVTIHSAGGRGRQQTPGEQRSLTIPLLPESSIDPVVRRLLQRGVLPALRPHPARARWRAMFRWLRRSALPLGAVVWLTAALLSPALAVAVLVAGLIAPVPLGLLEHRNLGNGENGTLVAARDGALNTTTVFAPRRKVQGVTVSASWFQRRRDLATLDVHVAGPGGGVEVLDLDAGWAADLGEILISPWVRAADPR